VEAARIMRDERVGSVVVVDNGQPLGIVTDRDLVVRSMALGGDPETVRIRDVMSTKPIFVSADRDLGYALDLMKSLAVRRIPVVDDSGQLVGLVSLDDAIVRLSSELAAVSETIQKEM
jgi:CBS domain-containing protein